MNTILLLGAGFSKNWGGWLAAEVFDYLLSQPEINSDAELMRILWANKTGGGFENALGEVQKAFLENPESNSSRLDAMQRSIIRMFDEMNSAFLSVNNFEFQSQREIMLRPFLARFDAIFTLNQDLLLEHHYRDNFDLSIETMQRKSSIALPGMKRVPSEDAIHSSNWARGRWMPHPEGTYTITPRQQPYFKLHGSSNWISSDGGPLLIIGGQKSEQIKLHPVLSRYAQEFKERLSRPKTRLMVIGYGFRDSHINEAIAHAVYEHGLKMFIVSPNGADIAGSQCNGTHPDVELVVNGLKIDDVFQHSLIGVSRRLLRETFGGDAAEFNKIMNFFKV